MTIFADTVSMWFVWKSTHNLQFHEAKVTDPELKTSPTVNDMDAWANSIWIRSLDVDRDIERRIRSETCILCFFLSSFFQKKSIMFQFFPVFFSSFCKVNSAAKRRDVESDLCAKVSTGGYQSGDPGESMCQTWRNE